MTFPSLGKWCYFAPSNGGSVKLIQTVRLESEEFTFTTEQLVEHFEASGSDSTNI